MATHPDIDYIIQLSERSSLFREMMVEKKKIEELKWLESEKAGEDIGYEKALFNWVRFHRGEWMKFRRYHPGQSD